MRGLLNGASIFALRAPDGDGGGGGAPPAGAAAPAAPVTPAGGAPAPVPTAAAPTVFADTLPEDIRTDAAFKDIKDLGSLAKSYLNAQKMLGVPKDQLLKLPTDPADAEGWKAVYSRLGTPESHDKYVVKPPEGQAYSDGDKAFQSAILPVLHKANLTQQQLDVILPEWNALAANSVKAQKAATTAGLAEAETKLKGKWGAAYDENVTLVEDTIGHFANELKLGDDLHKNIMDLPPAARPALGDLFVHLGRQLREDGVIGRTPAGGGNKAPTEAAQEINSLTADKAFMKVYQDKRDPGHADAVKRMERLYQMAYPQGTGA